MMAELVELAKVDRFPASRTEAVVSRFESTKLERKLGIEAERTSSIFCIPTFKLRRHHSNRA